MPDYEYKTGDLAVWDTYQGQANPIMVRDKTGEWTPFTLSDLAEMIYWKAWPKRLSDVKIAGRE